MNKGTLYIFTGPSGTGKGTLLSRVMARDSHLFLSVSATTRAPRTGETNGKHYYFLTHDEFDTQVREGAFLEYATYVGNSYGTLEAPVQQKLEEGCDVVLEIETQGAIAVHKKRPDAVMIFVAPPSFDELARRLYGRGTEEEDAVHKRLETARYEMTQARMFDYVVVNDNLDDATNELSAIFSAHRIAQKAEICSPG